MPRRVFRRPGNFRSTVLALPDPSIPLALQIQKLPMDDTVTSDLRLQATTQARRQRRPVPDPNRVQRILKPSPPDPDRNTLTRQQSLDPVDQTRLLLLQRPDLPLQVPPVFLLRRGHMDHAPEILLAGPSPAGQSRPAGPHPAGPSWPAAPAG